MNAVDKNIWTKLRSEAEDYIKSNEDYKDFLESLVLSNDSFISSISLKLSRDLSQAWSFADKKLYPTILQALNTEDISKAIEMDLNAVISRDPATKTILETFLFSKGFSALQAYRASNYHWHSETLLSYFLQSRSSQVYGVDIHPAAKIGKGIMLDHATGIVIGETSVIEDDVSIFQGVTLGGTGKEIGDRHPKVRKAVLISSGAKILGNVEIGEGAKIAAGSVVLEDVPEHMTVAGVPAKVVGKTSMKTPGTEIDHTIEGN